MKIYVPNTNAQCYVIKDSNTIRAYESKPTLNTSVNYTDYFINTHYLSQNGTQQFSQYTILPTCIDNSLITDDFYYRLDLDSILIIFIIILIFCFYFPYKIITRLFGRWFKI